MTDTTDPKTSEALALIDGGLVDLQSRGVIAADEVANLLLDLRLLLISAEGEATPAPQEPATTA